MTAAIGIALYLIESHVGGMRNIVWKDAGMLCVSMQAKVLRNDLAKKGHGRKELVSFRAFLWRKGSFNE